MKKRAQIVLSRWHNALDPRIIGAFADNLQRCSCAMCGNRRRFPSWSKSCGKTRQEVKSDLDFLEQVEYEMYMRLKRKL